MAFGSKKTVDFLQKERKELPTHRPVIIYMVCPLSARDLQQRTQLYSQYKKAEDLPEGVRIRDGSLYNICLVEAEHELSVVEQQLQATLNKYSEASYKVVVINGYGCLEGVVLSKEEERVLMTANTLAKLALRHHHNHHFHTLYMGTYGHKFADTFIKGINAECSEQKELLKLFAVTYFTSEAIPEAWQRPATVGEPHIELKSDITDFLSKHVQPNSPYKILDPQMSKNATCVLF